MKIALIGDCHFGIFSSIPSKSKLFQHNIRCFFEDVFIPTIKSRGVSVILQTGDLYDNRKANTSDAIVNSRECLFDPIRDVGIKYYGILGNHDIFYKESLEVNSPELYLSDYDNVHIIKEPTTLVFDDFHIDMIPWICDENRSVTTNFMKKSKSKYAFGHFEINGFEMSRNHYCDFGFDPEVFNTYETVWSGHFHKKMESGIIKYLGAPSQHTWDDVNSEKGFYIFDTDTHDIEFIPNPYELFVKIDYTDELKIKDTPHVEGKYVRVVAQADADKKKLEKFVDELALFAPYELKMVHNVDNVSEVEVSLVELESGGFDTVKFLVEYTKQNNDLLPEELELLEKEYLELYRESTDQ